MAAKTTVEFLKNSVVINATSKHSATVIFLHGLGDTGNGWSAQLADARLSHVKIICPTAPTMPVTLNHGFRMPSWFDLYSLDKTEKQDEEGIERAAANVQELLEYEQASTGISSNRIVLGGFSQGGSLTMYSALTYSKPLAGILAVSSWLPMQHVLPARITNENRAVPFLQCHGDADPMVAYKWGVMTSEFLKTVNTTDYTFNTYPGVMHTCTLEELEDMKKWLLKVVPPLSGSL